MLRAVFLSIIMCATAHAGDKGGNGGGVHLCAESVELYDFYEGRHPLLHGYALWTPDSSKNVDDYVRLALEKLAAFPSLQQALRARVGELRAIPQESLILPISIPRLPDADIPFVDESCEFAQVANWNERFDRLVIQRNLYERLDAMNRAGLFFHEAIYKLAREINPNIEDSDGVRPLVALLFSNETINFSHLGRVLGPAGLFILTDANGECVLRFEVTPIRQGESPRAMLELRFPRITGVQSWIDGHSKLTLEHGQTRRLACRELATAIRLSWEAALWSDLPPDAEIILTLNGAVIFRAGFGGEGPYQRLQDRRGFFYYSRSGSFPLRPLQRP